MYSGRVCCGPIRKKVITNSSIDRVTHSSAPARIAGAISGRTMWRSVRIGLAPRSADAHSRRRSKPCKRDATIRTTNGIVNTRWPATTVYRPSWTSTSGWSPWRKKISRPIPIRKPGIMIGKVNSRRRTPAPRTPPRTSGKATIVPTIEAMIVTTTATSIDVSRAFWIAESDARTWYQWMVSPVIGRPGVAASSNENRIRKAIGRYRKTSIAPVSTISDQRVCRAKRLTGIVSSGLVPLATGDHVLHPERLPEHDHDRGHEGGDDDRQGGALRELVIAQEVQDEVRDQAALGAANQGRRQELTQDRDEHEDAGGDDPRPDLRQQDVPERLVRPCAEVLGGVELGEVELLQ